MYVIVSDENEITTVNKKAVELIMSQISDMESKHPTNLSETRKISNVVIP